VIPTKLGLLSKAKLWEKVYRIVNVNFANKFMNWFIKAASNNPQGKKCNFRKQKSVAKSVVTNKK
jgi:hypothetical protein